MFAKKCDKCGVYYDAPMKGVSWPSTSYTIGEDGKALREYDLCPECKKAFDHFMHHNNSIEDATISALRVEIDILQSKLSAAKRDIASAVGGGSKCTMCTGFTSREGQQCMKCRSYSMFEWNEKRAHKAPEEG